jgi:hypothetical protein
MLKPPDIIDLRVIRANLALYFAMVTVCKRVLVFKLISLLPPNASELRLIIVYLSPNSNMPNALNLATVWHGILPKLPRIINVLLMRIFPRRCFGTVSFSKLVMVLASISVRPPAIINFPLIRVLLSARSYMANACKMDAELNQIRLPQRGTFNCPRVSPTQRANFNTANAFETAPVLPKTLGMPSFIASGLLTTIIVTPSSDTRNHFALDLAFRAIWLPRLGTFTGLPTRATLKLSFDMANVFVRVAASRLTAMKRPGITSCLLIRITP